MKAVSCQKGGRGLPSCSRDWALRFTLRSLNWSDMLRASRTNLMSWPILGGSSSWNFKETWTTSLGLREGIWRFRGLSPFSSTESALWGSSDLPALSFWRAFINTSLSWGEPGRTEKAPAVDQAVQGDEPWLNTIGVLKPSFPTTNTPYLSSSAF